MGGFAGSGASLGTLGIEITATVDEAVQSLEQFGRETSRIIDEQQAKWDSLSNIGGKLAGVGAALTAGITLPLTLLAKESIEAAGDMQALTNALNTITGSSKETAVQMERLKEIAKLPGLGLEEAVKGSLALQNIGMSAKDAERYLKAFGNAIAAAGGGRADLEAVVVQLRQMGSTGKVAAEDLKPILQRVPQVAAAAKAAFGSIDPEVLSKAAGGSQHFLEVIVGELEKIPPVAGGIKNAMENLGDSSQRAFAALGELLVPVIERLTPLIETMVGWVTKAAEWFGSLPAPVQAFVGTLIALAGALGPVLLGAGAMITAFASVQAALAPMGLTIGGLVLAIGPWVLAIGAAVAALVALGVWVAQNWDPIVATIRQAWDGIQEAWGAIWTGISGAVTGAWNAISAAIEPVWSPIATFFSTIWDAIAPYFTSAWNAISTTLTSVWNAISTAASSVWNGIVGVFQTFMEWAAKIPGANKLINLDEAWRSAEKLKTKMGDAAAATKTMGTEAKTASPPIVKLGKNAKKAGEKIEGAGKKAKEAHDEFKPLHERSALLDAMAQQLQGSYNKLASEVAKAKLAAGDMTSQTDLLIPPTKELNELVGKSNTQFSDLSKIHAPGAVESLAAIKTKALEFDTALKTLGVTSSTEYAAVATNAKLAYDAVLQSPMASQWEKDNALVKVLEAQKQAAISAGQVVPDEIEKQLAAVKAKLEDPKKGAPAMKAPFETMATEVSTIITNFTQDIAKSLFEGDTSWGEKAKGMLKSLGEAVTSSFITPATTALTTFMNSVLKDLMEGKGFGGVKKSIEDVGDTFKGVFGKGGEAASSAPSVPGGGGAAGGAAGGAGGAIGGWVSLISGAVTAVSSVIGNFQMKAMNEALDNIVKHTLQTANDMANLRQDEWDRFGGGGQAFSIMGRMGEILNDIRLIQPDVSLARMSIQAIEGGIGAGQAVLEGILNLGRENAGREQSFYDRALDMFERIAINMERLLGVSEKSMTMNLYGTDPDAVSAKIAAQLRLQGVSA